MELSFNQISDKEVEILCQYLPQTKIKYLNLSDNLIGNEGAKELSFVVDKIKSPIEIHLENNWIESEGFTDLLRASISAQSNLIFRF